MSGNGNQVPLASNQRGSISYPRASTPHRTVECYHNPSAVGSAYMQSSSSGSQTSAHAALRVQSSQPSAPPAPQDMSKSSMTGHSYVASNQTSQQRTQYPIQYRASQHTSRPTSHTSRQQPFIPGAAASAAPVMYPFVLQPTQLSLPAYQQPRSSAPYPYPYLGYIPGYNTPGHTPQYYYQSNSPQLPTPNPQTNAPGRSNPSTLVGPQGTTNSPSVPTSSLPLQQPTHMHQTMSGMRNTVPKRSHRLAIIDPVTQQDILSDLYSNDNSINNENSDRHTPQLESTHSIVEEFNRRVSEMANQQNDSSTKWNYVTKNVELPVSSMTNPLQTQPNAIICNNNDKSELTINDNKHLGPDIVNETNETPIVSAISDSPVIVPKTTSNVKQYQKNSDQPVVIESNKNYTHNKQLKSKNVPQNDDVEKCSDSNLIVTAPVKLNQVSLAPSSNLPYTIPNNPTNTQMTDINHTIVPQPQRIREPKEKNDRTEDKNKNKDIMKDKETSSTANNINGPVFPVGISSVDSFSNTIDPSTSQNQSINAESCNDLQLRKNSIHTLEKIEITDPEIEAETKKDTDIDVTIQTPELLSANDTKGVKENSLENQTKDLASASEAQAKLTLSLSNILRPTHPDSTMKDINLNNTPMDPDTANGNDLGKMDTTEEESNIHDKLLNNISNKNSTDTADIEINEKLNNSYENGNETDKVINANESISLPKEDNIETTSILSEKSELSTPPVFVPKYDYSEDQWSPVNKSGKRCYGIGLLKQIKDDPVSKNKPENTSKLETCNVIRTVPMQEFLHISRPMNDSLLPTFAKGSGMAQRSNNNIREPKKEGRNVSTTGRGSMKLSTPSGGNSHKPVIHVRLHDDVKLNEVDSAWKPTRFRQENMNEEELKTQELYKKFRGILNKLTPQKFDTLLDKIKTLEINNQKRLEGVIDLVFEKAIDEPNFSEAYAAMCNKLSKLKVPVDNAANPDQCINFRGLIINKCQNQFLAEKVDESLMKLENEVAECTDPTKKKELLLMLEEEQRKARMRSVGNVRFIGELYKLKMLTSKIMEYCMKNLIDKLEEEKLECLCKLLTTIGEQIENEVSGQLDNIFKRMQEIVSCKSNKISSRVRFMIQDVIELRKRKWVIKSVIDSQPKMMDQIQKEAEQQQRHIELMNSQPAGFRRDESNRGKRGDARRQTSQNNSFPESTWKPPRTAVDTSKFKAATPKSLSNIKLAPHSYSWNHGSGTKNITQINHLMISVNKNTFSMLENVSADPTSIRGLNEMPPIYHSKGASIERSTFTSRADFPCESSRSGSVTVPRSNSGSRSPNVHLPNPTLTTTSQENLNKPVQQAETLPEDRNTLKILIRKFLQFENIEEFVTDVQKSFAVQYHAALIKEIFEITLDKSPKEFDLIAKSFELLLSSNIFSADNFLAGMKDTLETGSDLYIDIPMLYENLGKLIAPHIAMKHITFADIHKRSENIIAANQGHLLLKAIFRNIKDHMGCTFAKNKWQESGLQLKDWMEEDQISKWMGDNHLEFLEEHSKLQFKLLQLMRADENCDFIKGWVQENVGRSSNDDWFMRGLIQAICEYAVFGIDGREMPQFNQDRMNKYASLIQDFGDSKKSREANCLFGIQQLIHRLEHPQGLALIIFQYLHEQYIITLDGFIEWEKSEREPEGKAVMLKMLTSFFTDIKEADNEDSFSED